MSGKGQKSITEFTDVIKEYMSTFLQKQGSGKVKIEEILLAWKIKENQSNLADLVKIRMPIPEPKKPRKAKDPNAPKRPRSAYILFCNDKRAGVREANPDMKMPQIAKELGKMWNGLKEKKKKPYLDSAAKDKERYDSEMAEFIPNNKPKGPKRAMTAYLYFCADKRAEIKEANPDMKVTDIAKELGRLWKEDFKDEKSRKKWVKKAEKDKERYEAEKASWTIEQVENVPQKKSKSKSKEIENVPQKKQNKPSGMVLFMQKIRPEIESENPDWDAKQIVAEMKRQWMSLKTEERLEYDT